MSGQERTIDTSFEGVARTARWLKERFALSPELALVLGSGLGGLADHFEDRVCIDYAEIPNFPVSTVEGHAGRLVVGTLEGRPAVAMQGRFHYYEGWAIEEVTFPIRVFKQLGCQALLVTNASGGINPDMRPGDLMLIVDHLNMTGVNPLRGHNDPRIGPRFPDMTEAYDFELRRHAMAVAREHGLMLRTGIYAGLQGPSYETPAEIKMLRRLGGDAVGMSTVPEVIVANHCGLRVLGISCITNMAAGISDQKLTHEEVTETATEARGRFMDLIHYIVRTLPL